VFDYIFHVLMDQDMIWEGSDLALNQDKPGQLLCNFIDSNGQT